VGTLTTNDPNAIRKREGDKKAPAGVFAIGRVFGYAAKPPAGTTIPYRKVTKWDAWIDDVNNPLYNQHVVVDPNRVPAWFSKQKMRHGDFAYKWLLEIRHNSDPPKAGFGSAIFFHIRRGADRTTAGCTTMKESDLTRLISWLRPSAAPHYVLLPRAEYKARQATWRLP
ncbi:MAG: L,D-transpeptidase family protein, partial [Verrucomicrobiota bacterium]